MEKKSILEDFFCRIKTMFSIRNIKQMFLYLIFMSVCYAIFLIFSPILPVQMQDQICRISGFGVIVIMLILLFLLFSSLKLIKSGVVKLGIIGSIGTIIMYSLWLSIDYGAKHPYASATGFNVSEITLGLACAYLILDKLLNHLNNKNKG